jgi:hypothetical protein
MKIRKDWDDGGPHADNVAVSPKYCSDFIHYRDYEGKRRKILAASISIEREGVVIGYRYIVALGVRLGTV